MGKNYNNNNLKITYTIKPSFTTRKLKEAEEQLYKIKKLIGSYDEISTLENEIYRIIGDSNE